MSLSTLMEYLVLACASLHRPAAGHIFIGRLSAKIGKDLLDSCHDRGVSMQSVLQMGKVQEASHCLQTCALILLVLLAYRRHTETNQHVSDLSDHLMICFAFILVVLS